MNERESAMTDPKSGAAEGKGRHPDALEELVALLRRIQFSGHDGPYVEGSHVAVLVDPCWNEDGKTIRVTIQCIAWGHRAVPWEGMPLFIYPSDAAPDQACQLAFLNARGYAVVQGLQPGEYRMISGITYGTSRKEIVPAEVERPWDRPCRSTDGRVRVSVRQEEGKLYTVSAEADTQEGMLRGATVLCAFADKDTNEIRVCGRARFQSGEKALRAEWGQLEHASADDPFEARFAFCLIPAQED